MTPEEKAVIEAAMCGWDGQALTDVDMSEMSRAVEALILSCPECNHGGHTCPGDGNAIGHTQTDCGDHDETRGCIAEHDPAAPCEWCLSADSLPCWECLTDPTEDPAPWCDCSGVGERCSGPCRRRAHAPDRCPNLSPAWRKGQALAEVEQSYRAEVLKQEWLPATFAQCLAGDHIRLGAEETDVLSSSTGTWHVGKEASRYPVSWEHTELRMDLAANPGVQQYPPNAACEILCTPERKAFLLMQQTFPGSAVVSSDVD